MSWSVDTIYSFQKFLIRKNQSGNISRNDFFLTWNAEQAAEQDDIVGGKWQRNNNGKAGLNTGMIQNEVIMTKLAPFILEKTLPITAGLGTKPTDLIYTLALRINGEKVFQINADQKWAVEDDVIDPPSISDDSYYYYEIADGTVTNNQYYSFLPNTVTSFDLNYVAACPDIVWGFNLDGQGREVYNPATSVQPKWNQNSIISITKRTLTSLGVSYKDTDFYQFGTKNTTTGDS